MKREKSITGLVFIMGVYSKSVETACNHHVRQLPNMLLQSTLWANSLSHVLYCIVCCEILVQYEYA